MENAPSVAPVERLVRLPFEVGHIPRLPHEWHGHEDGRNVASVSPDGRNITMKRGDDRIDLVRESRHHFVTGPFHVSVNGLKVNQLDVAIWDAINAATRQVSWPYSDERVKQDWVYEAACGCKVEYSGMNQHYIPKLFACRAHDTSKGGLRMCDVHTRIKNEAKAAHRSEFGFG